MVALTSALNSQHGDGVSAPKPEADTPAVEFRNLSNLKQHPKQSEFFPDESLEADLELASDMKARSLQKPIDILPDGTILGGHRRVAAARHLGWTTIAANVRHDLANDPEQQESYLIGDNYLRRQLSEFQKVQCAKRRVELAKQGKATLPEECNNLAKTRDKIGRLLNLSGRQVDRYLKVLKTPTEVQQACEAGHISLVDACQVAFFSEATQQQIALDLQKGGLANAKVVFDRYRPSKADTCRGAGSIWSEVRRAMNTAVKELSGQEGNIRLLDQGDLDAIAAFREVLDVVEIHAQQQIEDELEEVEH